MPGVKETGTETEDMPLEEAFTRLDAMIEKLQDRSTSLEESFAVYEEGMKLLRYCTGKIDLIEKKVMTLSEDGELNEF